MKKQAQLVYQHLENISRDALEKHQAITGHQAQDLRDVAIEARSLANRQVHFIMKCVERFLRET